MQLISCNEAYNCKFEVLGFGIYKLELAVDNTIFAGEFDLLMSSNN